MADASFTFLTKEEFERLAQAEKIAYIERAVQALKISPNSPEIFKDHKASPDSRSQE